MAQRCSSVELGFQVCFSLLLYIATLRQDLAVDRCLLLRLANVGHSALPLWVIVHELSNGVASSEEDRCPGFYL